MSESELAEHAGYLADEVKLTAYRRALEAVCAPGGRIVLDIGAGSGILGLVAAGAGAAHVWAVDSGPIIGPAEDVVQLSDYASVITHVRGVSTQVDLPTEADVAVCDQIGGFVHDAGVLGYFADARRRLLAPDAILVPARFRLFVAPVECDHVRDQIELWGSRPAGLDFSPFQDLAVNTEHRVDGGQARPLAPGALVAAIDADHTEPVKGRGESTIEVAGRCDGLVGWFEADLGGGAMLTNEPGRRHRMQRWCNVYPLADGAAVTPGDTIEAEIDVRPVLHAVTWRTKVTRQDGSTAVSERHSTLLGQFLDRDHLARSGGSPIVSTAAGRAAARALELADGSRSTDEILARVCREVDGDSGEWEVLERAARSVLDGLTVPKASPS